MSRVFPTDECRWCGQPLIQRDNESPSAFAKRKHCDRSCQVSTQNSQRGKK